MAKFRKKPVVIEAVQFTGLDSYLDINHWMQASGDTNALAGEVRYSTPIMLLQTIEGTMAANPGDWIIRGVKGEFYPCKPDIFDATYELVDDWSAAPPHVIHHTIDVTVDETLGAKRQAQHACAACGTYGVHPGEACMACGKATEAITPAAAPDERKRLKADTF